MYTVSHEDMDAIAKDYPNHVIRNVILSEQVKLVSSKSSSSLKSSIKGGHKDRKPRVRGQHTDAGREDRDQEDHKEELPYNIELSAILGRWGEEQKEGRRLALWKLSGQSSGFSEIIEHPWAGTGNTLVQVEF
uniref:Uncharacterized protein n=1 Tax=Timema poppense TaxID=170557 RepID=A0A7R9DM46_TIMPO|nr:unnamed protein product [Timema poppensis]